MLIGRKYEKGELEDAYNSRESEFVAIYGRRRIGKTFLVREVFKDKFSFTHSGVAKLPVKGQLQAFYNSLLEQGYNPARVPRNWLEAFHILSVGIGERKERRKVIFLDELPWMDSHKSDFLPAFEHFWNGWASARKDIVLIVCGSATSWIINKIVNNHGGLHDRLSKSIRLNQFTLRECEEYVGERGLRLTRMQIIEAYMVFGGVPYYWSKLDRKYSLPQNIDRMFFAENAMLANEFDNLYSSLFKHPEPYVKLIEVLGKKKAGMTREELSSASGISQNGNMSKYLNELEACGFIRCYTPFGKQIKHSVFQLIDNFTLFHFKFLASKKIKEEGFWIKSQKTPVYANWCGLAFERVCLLHIRQIKHALGVSGVISNEYSWRTPPYADLPGVEVDLLIDRADQVVNICEMKYTVGKFMIDKKYSAILKNKVQRLYDVTKTRKAVVLTMISANGLTANAYANEVSTILTADDLFG